MDRQIVYSGQIPLETDLLNTNKNVMVALGKMAAAMFGSSTFVNGLSVGPNSPAALNVIVQPGEIYTLANIDGTAYSSLAADTTHSIVKQGIMLDTATLNTPAPATAGQSINYLIQAQFSEVDGNAVVLPYYNASNPSQAYSGPNGAGTTNNTARKGTVVVSAKAGVTATTGSQTTPAPDAGYVGLYVVTVANGQSTVTAGNISQYSAAPILPAGLVAAAQSGSYGYAVDTGSANVYQAAYSPAITAVADGMTLKFKAKTANTGASTFSPNGLAAAPIWGADHQALTGGEIVANGDVWVQWNSSLNGGSGAWILIDSTGGYIKSPTPALGDNTTKVATMAALFAGLYTGKGMQCFTASGNFTVPAGVTTLYLSGAGAGGGGAAYQTSGNGGGGGGAGGSCIRRAVTVTPGQTYAVTIGTGGTGATVAGNAGGSGGTTSFGSLLTLAGGGGGTSAGSGGGPGAVTGGSGGIAWAGGQGEQYNRNTGTASGGNGGSSLFGVGGYGGGTGATPGSGQGYGSGGGGGAAGQGNNGAQGCMIVEW